MLAMAQPVAAEEEIVYEAQRGDTLIGIGKRLLEQPGDWRILARLNRVPDPNRIMPGESIRIPTRLLRGTPEPAQLLQAHGGVRASAADGSARALTPGAMLDEGTRLATGDDGYLTLRLPDGSTLRVQAGSEADLQQTRRLGDGSLRATLRLIAGRIEAAVTQITGGAPRFEVKTPQAALAVRGTEFRVGVDRGAGITRGEVLTGSVALAGASGGAGTVLNAGFGAQVDAAQRIGPVTPLLPAPDVGALPALVQRLPVQLPVTPLAQAQQYRVQVVRADGAQEVGATLLSGAPLVRIDALDDGDWIAKVRGVDRGGLEGHEARHPFRLKARPEPPVTSAPVDGARLPVGPVSFTWAFHPQATHYQLQLADTPAFGTVARKLERIAATNAEIADLPAGIWYWRIATVRSVNGAPDAGPWSDALRIDLRPLPLLPERPAVGAAEVTLGWRGLAGQQFDFELATRADFAQPLVAQRLETPQVRFARPAPGRYFLRYRAIDADGYVGPYIAPQQLTIEPDNCVRSASGGCIGAGSDTLRSP